MKYFYIVMGEPIADSVSAIDFTEEALDCRPTKQEVL